MIANKKIFYPALLAVMLIGTGARAQRSLLLNFCDYMPASIQTNPSFFPKNKMFIGLPVLSSIYMKTGTNKFVYSDLIRYNDMAELALDPDNFISRLKPLNLLSVNFETDLLSGGMRLGNYYISGFITERIDFHFAFPKEMMELAYYGNGHFLNETVNMDNIGLNVSHFRDYSLGIARKFDKLDVGARFRILYGMANVTTQKSHLSLFTDSTGIYDVTAATDFQINTSLPDFDDDLDPLDYLANTRNKGYAFDFGGTYRLNDKFTFALSAVDLGYIYWKDNIKDYISNGSFTFSGFDISNFVTEDNSDEDPFQSILDSASDAFEVTDTVINYQTHMAPRLYASTTYNLSEGNRVGFLYSAEFYNRRMYPSFTLYFCQENDNILNSMLSYSVINGDFKNLGAGSTVRLGPLQTYLLVDNLIGLLYPQHTRMLHVKLGMHLTFGTKKYRGEKSNRDDEFAPSEGE
ncbi:MAG: hypothetical protein H6585_00930 [Flavobacteriales bacterium]|nr:hypothetical protein [Flavobacteriales bacterium]MCB9446890.1 hypothetical protein [Flavobacteriales bacterium]